MAEIENTLNRLIDAINKNSQAITSASVKSSPGQTVGKTVSVNNPAGQTTTGTHPASSGGKKDGFDMSSITAIIASMYKAMLVPLTSVLGMSQRDRKGMAEDYIDTSLSMRNAGQEPTEEQRLRLETKIIDRGDYKIARRKEAFEAFNVTSLTGDYPMMDAIIGGLGLGDGLRKFQSSVEMNAMEDIKERNRKKSQNRNKP